MEYLDIKSPIVRESKRRAAEEAKKVQKSVTEWALRYKKDPPKYALTELVGKGSYGKVFKAKDMRTAMLVAVKIIDLDASDISADRRAPASYDEFMREVEALKILTSIKAKNVNYVIESMLVGHTMWLVSEYCAGGSVTTLMKPTQPGGLTDPYIRIILREVAEALKWIHGANIIHRDLKCANVLVTENGGVQVCDFGVAGTLESGRDKRATFVGTPNWMAPELFQEACKYGKEVDIWAFGAMAYEMATGCPPYFMERITGPELLKVAHDNGKVPRLDPDSDIYTPELCDMVAFCMEPDSKKRPKIAEVQAHPYIAGTEEKLPTSRLVYLMLAFKLWEDDGGHRKSLFYNGGAQFTEDTPGVVGGDDEWNFHTTEEFDQNIAQKAKDNMDEICHVYRPMMSQGEVGGNEEADDTLKGPRVTPRARRAPPPNVLAPMKGPLEKVFDRNTISNYDDNSKLIYHPSPSAATTPPRAPANQSDLPLRDNHAPVKNRETLIDLDAAHDVADAYNGFSATINLDLDTIRPISVGDRSAQDFSRPPLSDPADINPNRRTQDWKFPVFDPPASANPVSRHPPHLAEPGPTITPGGNGRPPLIHHPTEPVGAPTVAYRSDNGRHNRYNNYSVSSIASSDSSAVINLDLATPNPNIDRESLIDLDFGMPEPEAVPPRIRTSDASMIRPSTGDSENAPNDSFAFERHPSIRNPSSQDRPAPTRRILMGPASPPPMMRLPPTPSVTDDTPDFFNDNEEYDYDGYQEYRTERGERGRRANDFFAQDMAQQIPNAFSARRNVFTQDMIPPIPSPPSSRVMMGEAQRGETVRELSQKFESLKDQLQTFKGHYEQLSPRHPPPTPPPAS